MTTDITDLYHAFVYNYHTLQIAKGQNNATWTHRVLGFFDQLGRMLGHLVFFEEAKCDLTWWFDEEYRLHIEHENRPNKERIIEKTIKKVLISDAKRAIAICYPKTEKERQEIEEWIKNNSKKMRKPEEVMIILDNSYFIKENNIFRTHIITEKWYNIWSERKKIDENGYFTLVFLEEEEEESDKN
ncbi:hypothetical protein ES708_20776 [subsurface metagenome]